MNDAPNTASSATSWCTARSMGTVRALAVIGLALTALLAPAVAQACERSDEGQRYEARSSAASSGQVLRTTVVLCDHRSGRERVLRRGRLDPSADSGVRYQGAAAAGRRLVWVEERHWRGRARAVLVEARATDGSVFRRSELARNPIRVGLGELDAVVTEGGTVATFSPVADSETPVVQRLVLYRGGREIREIDRGDLSYLDIEDIRTLRWVSERSSDAPRHYHDLFAPPRDGAGCPQRERFERILVNGAVEVTEARYGGRREIAVLRACLRETGQDRVVGQAQTAFGSGTVVGGPRVDGDWIVIFRDDVSRYYGCEFREILTVDLLTGRAGPEGNTDCESPGTGEPIAITDKGILAHVAQREDVSTVVAFAPETTALDTGPPGSITNLRADGPLLRWENAGQPRSAAVEPAA